MTDIQPQDIVWRGGGRAWQRYGVGYKRLAPQGRGGELAAPTIARADATTCATFTDAGGLIRTAAANVPRLEWLDTNGDGILDTPAWLLEGAATNVVLQNRDLTQAAWVKTTMTTAKDQTGADGAANAASSLLATGANATCLQAITLASSARMQSAYVKRLVGSGTVQMTMDNGATWTTITLTTAYQPLSIPGQTLANPTVGFRIVTSGDKIAVDFVQNETGTIVTSPIATAAAAVTRAGEYATFPLNVYPGVDLTVYLKVWLRSIDTTTTRALLQLGGLGATARLALELVAGFWAPQLFMTAGSRSSTVVLSNVPSVPAMVELRAVLSATGQVTAGLAAAGGTEVVGSTSPSVAVNGWTAPQLVVNSESGSALFGNYSLIDGFLVRGQRTLAECRAVPSP